MKSDARYDAILHLPHPTSRNHPRMSITDRAAQFAAFKALTGYDDEVEEAARLTDERIFPDDQTADALNISLCMLRDRVREQPVAAVTCFVPDTVKSGGRYVTKIGRVKRVDGFDRTLEFTDGTVIPIDNILEIDGEIFAQLPDPE